MSPYRWKWCPSWMRIQKPNKWCRLKMGFFEDNILLLFEKYKNYKKIQIYINKKILVFIGGGGSLVDFFFSANAKA